MEKVRNWINFCNCPFQTTAATPAALMSTEKKSSDIQKVVLGGGTTTGYSMPPTTYKRSPNRIHSERVETVIYARQGENSWRQ